MVKRVCQLLVEDPFGWEPDPKGTIWHPGSGIRLVRVLRSWYIGAATVQVGWFDNARLNRAYHAHYEARAKIWLDHKANNDLERALADQKARVEAYECKLLAGEYT